MSTVPAPQPRSRPPSTTREQLDELDALLQRMLELPVDPAGAPAEEPDSPATLAEAPPPVVAEAPVELAPLPAPPPVAEPPSPDSGPGGEALEAERATVSRNVNGVVPRAGAEGGGEPDHAAPGWLGPVVLLNRLFDRATRPLGVVGYWLRRPRGRAVLGWAGVGLLALALGLVFCTWRGWF